MSWIAEGKGDVGKGYRALIDLEDGQQQGITVKLGERKITMMPFFFFEGKASYHFVAKPTVTSFGTCVSKNVGGSPSHQYIEDNHDVGWSLELCCSFVISWKLID